MAKKEGRLRTIAKSKKTMIGKPVRAKASSGGGVTSIHHAGKPGFHGEPVNTMRGKN